MRSILAIPTTYSELALGVVGATYAFLVDDEGNFLVDDAGNLLTT